MIRKSNLWQLSTLALCMGLVSCGGSGSGAGEDQPLAVWEQGQFADADSVKNQCVAPRTGINPDTGSAYPDTNGRALDEKLWLRSWSDDSYLWYDEIVDNNPDDFSISDYFEQLKTDQRDANGAQKDNFHFQLATDEWQQQSQSGTSLSYGFAVDIDGTSPNRQITISDTEPNSPAAEANLDRGDQIIAINNIPIADASETEDLNLIGDALFPQQTGQTFQFSIKKRDTDERVSISMTATTVTSQPVKNVKVIDIGQDKIGYAQFNSHIATAELALYDAFSELAEERIDDLVLDIRYNGGGLLAIASQVAYMIAGADVTNDKTFERTRFNDKHPAINPITAQTLSPFPFYDQSLGFSLEPGTPLPSLNLNRVFLLTTDNTCSASEAIINGLQGVGIEVILIGGTTCGKPYGFYPADNCGTTYFTIQFQGENELGFGDYAAGFAPYSTPATDGVLVPGCVVADDLSHVLGNPNEALLAAAINYRIDASCPSPSGKSLVSLSSMRTRETPADISDQRPLTVIFNHRDLTLPK